jgi:CBS-domain-containing membrane protein
MKRDSSVVGIYFSKMKTRTRSPLKVIPKNAFIGFLGGTITIGLLLYLSYLTKNPWIMAPFGASCVLAFGIHDAPFSQPRNIIGGHVVTTFVGLCMYHLFGNEGWVLAIAVGLGIGAMMLTKTTHPPAGANPLVVISSGSAWSFLITPVLIGATAIAIVAVLFNNLFPTRKYPTFWI